VRHHSCQLCIAVAVHGIPVNYKWSIATKRGWLQIDILHYAVKQHIVSE